MNLEDIRKFVRERLILNASGYVNARESAKLDFKESFIWGIYRDDYVKTMASFANNQGGLLIFGIKDKPRKIIGLKTNNFHETSPEIITQYLRECLSSPLTYEMEELEVKNIKLGWIYVYEESQKPIVCTKNSSKTLKDGDVYFRNGARSERINSAQLMHIIGLRLEQTQQTWLKHMEAISSAGVENAAILDVGSGMLTGQAASMVIDESLLGQIQFIREGHFVEKDGAPALRIVGELKGSGTVIRQRIDPDIEYQYSAGMLAEEIGFSGSSGSNSNNGAALIKYFDLFSPEYVYEFTTGRGAYRQKKYSQKAVDFLKERSDSGDFMADKDDQSMKKIRKAAQR